MSKECSALSMYVLLKINNTLMHFPSLYNALGEFRVPVEQTAAETQLLLDGIPSLSTLLLRSNGGSRSTSSNNWLAAVHLAEAHALEAALHRIRLGRVWRLDDAPVGMRCIGARRDANTSAAGGRSGRGTEIQHQDASAPRAAEAWTRERPREHLRWIALRRLETSEPQHRREPLVSFSIS